MRRWRGKKSDEIFVCNKKFVLSLSRYEMILLEELNGDFYPLAKSKNIKRVFRSPLLYLPDRLRDGIVRDDIPIPGRIILKNGNHTFVRFEDVLDRRL